MVVRLYCRTVLAGLIAITLIGCSQPNRPAINRSPYPGPRVLALAPCADRAGAQSLDMMAVTDAFYTELQNVEGFQVVPVNRTLSAMNALQLDRLNSPADAMQLAEALGADGVIVTAVTQYDPYFPPRIGLIVQLYDRQNHLSGSGRPDRNLDPIELARQPRPFEVEPSDAPSPTTTVVSVIDVDRDQVATAVKRYAAGRGRRNRPAGWKNYARGRNFLSFAAHQMIAEMLEVEQNRMQTQGPPQNPRPQPYQGP